MLANTSMMWNPTTQVNGVLNEKTTLFIKSKNWTGPWEGGQIGQPIHYKKGRQTRILFSLYDVVRALNAIKLYSNKPLNHNHFPPSSQIVSLTDTILNT